MLVLSKASWVRRSVAVFARLRSVRFQWRICLCTRCISFYSLWPHGAQQFVCWSRPLHCLIRFNLLWNCIRRDAKCWHSACPFYHYDSCLFVLWFISLRVKRICSFCLCFSFLPSLFLLFISSLFPSFVFLRFVFNYFSHSFSFIVVFFRLCYLFPFLFPSIFLLRFFLWPSSFSLSLSLVLLPLFIYFLCPYFSLYLLPPSLTLSLLNPIIASYCLCILSIVVFFSMYS